MTSLAYAALWVFTFAIPWENIIVIPGIGTISRLLGMVAVGFAVMAAVMSGRLRRPQPFHVAAVLFVICAGFGVFRTADEGRAIGKFGTYLQLLLVLWMVWELAPTFRKQRGLLLAYVFGAYVAAVNTVLVYRSSLGTPNRRFAAQGFDPNDLGMTLALALPMAWYLGMTHRQPLLRWACRAYLPLGLVAIGLTGSRGALVASIVALVIVPVSMTQLSPGRMAAGVFLLFASGAAAVTFIPASSWERYSATRAEAAAGVGNLNSRLVVWKMGLRAFSEKPILGYGTSGFNWAVRSQSHNSYLSVLVEQGIVGFVLYAMMFITVFIRVMRMPTMERRFALVLLATLAVAMLPLVWDDRKPVWLILALLTAIAAALPVGTARVPPLPQRLPRRPMPIARQRAAS
ncbi:MAG TPA: O-antigen ligase family protein [Gemmatimonadales bacterium]|nr:O-antigen ligase family protein [Gemmatimonadales bacterium]